MADTNNGKKLAEVMAEIKKQPNGLAEFAADPVGYLQRKGINADGLTLSAEPSPQVTDEELAMVAGGGCFGVGYYGCYNEGD